MLNQFSRIQLLIGKEAMETLKTKKIVIFGIGGVGGFVCDALARSGIENFTLIDNDYISITNINRQLIATLDTIGKAKVDVMKEHLLKINENIQVECIKCFVLKENIDQFDFTKYDYVIDAIDTISAKLAIIEKCDNLKIPVMSSMGCGNKMNPTMLEVADIYKTSMCPLAKVMRYELKRRRIKHLKVVYSKEQPIQPIQELVDQCKQQENNSKQNIPGSSAFVPPVAGYIIASEVIKDLIKFNHR